MNRVMTALKPGELSACFIAMSGGTESFVRQLAKDYLKLPAGSAGRGRIIETVLKDLKSAHANYSVQDDNDMLDADDLEAKAERILRKLSGETNEPSDPK